MAIFNLRERIFAFIQNIFQLVKILPNDKINSVLITQLIRSSTSIGANYEEADGTPTRKDFAYKMSIVKKEAKETKYWLKILKLNTPSGLHTKITELESETEELIRITATIVIKSSS